MATRSDDAGAEIEGLISSYAASHPNAADTLEGVHAWWVGARVPGATRTEVELACLRLVAAGVIERAELPDGVTLFVAASRGSLTIPVETPKPN
jgi:hypothetical protein